MEAQRLNDLPKKGKRVNKMSNPLLWEDNGGINLMKDAKDFYTVNDKAVQRETEDDKLIETYTICFARLNICKMFIHSIVIYRFTAIPMKK